MDTSTLREAASGEYADINGLHLFYQRLGSGRPMILLHGGPGMIGLCVVEGEPVAEGIAGSTAP